MVETLKKLHSSLDPIYGRSETDAIIRIIFHHLKNWSLTDMLIHRQDELSPFIKSQIDEILNRLLNYEPIQYITGEARFHGMEMNVKPGVLIPRPETDELTDIIIKENDGKEDLRVLDIATGSGCIAVALSKGIARASVTAVDISEKALACAERNAAKNGADVRFVRCDILDDSARDAIGGSGFDIIVSNPPYIPLGDKASMHANVTMHEPHEALFVPDADPLLFYVRIARLGRELLRDGGSLCFEIYERCSERVAEMLASESYTEIVLMNDANLKPRMICCRK